MGSGAAESKSVFPIVLEHCCCWSLLSVSRVRSPELVGERYSSVGTRGDSAKQPVLQSQAPVSKGSQKCAPRPQNPLTTARVAVWGTTSTASCDCSGQGASAHGAPGKTYPVCRRYGIRRLQFCPVRHRLGQCGKIPQTDMTWESQRNRLAPAAANLLQE